MPKYSIITPVFNSFGLMGRYFESLLNQTYKDFEVIIVDDCSTDGSYDFLAEYSHTSALDIHLIRSERNCGPGLARNMGMDAAKGEWITFVDNDDWVNIDLLERIDAVIAASDVHCVIYDYFVQKDEKKTAMRSMYCGETGVVSLSDCMIYARNHTVGKFYKLADCTNASIRFPDLRRCEDVAFVARAIDACGSVYYLHEPMYYYCQRNNSLSNDTSLDERDLIRAFQILENALGEKYPLELKEKSVPDLLYGVLLIMCKTGRSKQEISDYIKRYSRKYQNWGDCKIMKCLGKGKRVFLLAAKYEAVGMLKAIAYAHSKMIRGGYLRSHRCYLAVIYAEYVWRSCEMREVAV